MNRLVAIRFDVSPNIGTGHVSRALAFGAELTKRKLDHFYVTTSAGVESATMLGVPHSQLYGFDEKFGEEAWICRHTDVTHVIADFCHSRHIDSEGTIHRILQAKALHVTVIDSMPPYHFNGKSNPAPDVVITPYFGAETLRTRPLCGKWFSGAQYAILEKSIVSLRQSLNQEVPEPGNYILICCGGSDPTQLSSYILQRILDHGVPEFNIKVVIGPLFAPKLTKIIEILARKAPHKISLEFGQNSIAQLIADCGFFIGTVGIVRYEIACLGKNMFLVQENSNYENYLRGFENAGLGQIYLLNQAVDRKRFNAMIKRLGDRQFVRKHTKPNRHGFDLVDGQGVHRCLNALVETAISEAL